MRRLILGLCVLALLLVGGAYALPQKVQVARTTTIAAPPAKVYAIVNSFKQFNEWSPWAAKDPNAKYTFEGKESGVGAKMSWSSDKPGVGSGSQEIINTNQDKGVLVKLDFAGQGPALAFYNMAPVAEGTKVQWGIETDMGMNPIARWFGLMLDKQMGPDFETGLANLKALAEKPE